MAVASETEPVPCIHDELARRTAGQPMEATPLDQRASVGSLRGEDRHGRGCGNPSRLGALALAKVPQTLEQEIWGRHRPASPLFT